MVETISDKNKQVPIGGAAKFFGVSVDTIRRWDKAGLLHSVRPTGKTRFFYQKDLDALKSAPPKAEVNFMNQSRIEPFTLKRIQRKTANKAKNDDVYSANKSDELPPKVNPPTVPTEPSKKILTRSNLTPLQRIPEFAAATVFFLLLLTMGLRNIINESTKSPKPNSAPTVLSATTKVQDIKPAPTIVIKPSPTEELKPTQTIELQATPTAEIKRKTLLVKIADGSPEVNIRKESTIKSESIGKAIDGDTFEFVSLDLGWYRVKLADGSTGFISAKYIIKND